MSNMMVLPTGARFVDAQHVPCIAAMQPDHFCCQEVTSYSLSDARGIWRIRSTCAPIVGCSVLLHSRQACHIPRNQSRRTARTMCRETFYSWCFSQTLTLAKSQVSSPRTSSRGATNRYDGRSYPQKWPPSDSDQNTLTNLVPSATVWSPAYRDHGKNDLLLILILSNHLFLYLLYSVPNGVPMFTSISDGNLTFSHGPSWEPQL
ncbi:hypothetical protein QBC34DRAFT_173834 [Podospora aff. communis PSN243]|uniref:Uncharacterized protein n=1 Tax=Podospora aff. communis PSN243 TaxID=3040156 RepID=A0AAV9H4M3_9PEZI|nr:hypothetical protein QBC34DRAFT_173834 [Podospora aff. communis PSN243]